MPRLCTLLVMLVSATTALAQTSQPASQAALATGEKRFHLLFTADIAGRYGWPGCGKAKRDGADLSQLVTAVERRRQEVRQAGDGAALVVAAGNMIRPDAMGNHIFNEGRAWADSAVQLLKRVGFDAVAVGPLDFGAHPDALRAYMSRMKAAGLPLLAANVACKDGRDFRCHHLLEGPRYLVLRKGELKIGVFALVREDLETRILARSAGSLDVKDPLKVARELIPRLRRREKVDLVVTLANLNLESNAPEPVLSFARKLGRDAPDLIVANSMYYREGDDFISRIHNYNGPPILGTDRFGQHLGDATVHYTRTAGDVMVTRVEVGMQPVAKLPAEKKSARLVDDLRAELCRALNQPLGRARFARAVSQSEFITYVMEVMRHRVGAEIALLNDSAVADTSFPMQGQLTREDILRAIRTETQMGTFRMSGTRLKKVLGGYVSGSASGLNVHGLTRKGTSWYVNNRPLLDGQHYLVAVTRFVASGGDGLIALRAERFRDSGFTLRRVVLDFFEENRQQALDGDPTVDLATDFPDPWERWVLYGESNVGLGVSNLSVQNGNRGKRYNKPLLLLDNVTTFKFDMGIGLGASNRNHAVESDISLKYGKTWTLTAQEEAEGKEATGAETLDEIRVDFLYRLNMIRNRRAPGRWYLPVPYAEATLISEFTADNTYTRADGSTGSYHYLELGGTVGVGFLLHPYLFAKAGFAVSGELLTPEEALQQVGEERDARTGIYLGYKLRRLKLVSSVRHPLQLESRLDYYATDLARTRRQELKLQSKIYLGLTPYLYVTASHSLYIFDNQCTRPVSECYQGDNDTSFANDVSLGLDLLLDYRHQLF